MTTKRGNLLFCLSIAAALCACGAATPDAVPAPSGAVPATATMPSERGGAWPTAARTATRRPTAQPPTADPAVAMEAFARALEQQELFAPPSAGGGAQPAALNPFAYLFPELRTLPAPDWLREGVRVTYYGQSATISNVAGEDGAGGAGYLQCDLVALDGANAVVSMKLYLDLGNDTVMPVMVLPSLGLPGAGDYWLHPDALADAERVANDELLVARMPTTIAGHGYRVVRFEYRPEGAEYVWVYDQESGRLLFYRHAIGEAGDDSRQLTDVTLVGVRELDLPWAGGTAPDWVRRGGYLEYEGSYTALVLGQPAGSFDYGLRADVEAVEPRWSVFLVTEALAGRTSSVSWRLAGGAQLADAIWLSPEAVAALRGRRGTLDRDPLTGEALVLSAGPGGQIVLTASNAAYESVLTYDGDDGALLRLAQWQIGGAAGSSVELDLTSRR